jgi:hypothetical protein
MLVQNHAYGYSRKKKYVTGRGFVDSLSNVFNSIKASAVPAMRSIGSYVSNNKDLIVKPLLGAVGSLAATGLTAGVPALISHIMRRKQVTVDEPKYNEILQNLAPPSTSAARGRTEGAQGSDTSGGRPPVTNIIGSGAWPPAANGAGSGATGVRRKRGAGIKKF